MGLVGDGIRPQRKAGVVDRFLAQEPDAQGIVLANIERAGRDMVHRIEWGGEPEPVRTPGRLAPSLHRIDQVAAYSHRMLSSSNINVAHRDSLHAPHALEDLTGVSWSPSALPPVAGSFAHDDPGVHHPHQHHQGEQGQPQAHHEHPDGPPMHSLARLSDRRIGLRAAARYGIDPETFGRGWKSRAALQQGGTMRICSDARPLRVAKGGARVT